MPDDTTPPRIDDPARDAHITLPSEQQAVHAGEAEEHFLNPDVDLESNELPATGRVCARCGRPFRPTDDVRKTARGTYQHEVCP